MPTAYATQPFTHGSGRYAPGDALHVSQAVALELVRAGLARMDGDPMPEKKTVNGEAAPLFVLPPAPASQPQTLSLSAAGDSPEPEKRKRGRPRKSAAS